MVNLREFYRMGWGASSPPCASSVAVHRCQLPTCFGGLASIDAGLDSVCFLCHVDRSMSRHPPQHGRTPLNGQDTQHDGEGSTAEGHRSGVGWLTSKVYRMRWGASTPHGGSAIKLGEAAGCHMGGAATAQIEVHHTLCLFQGGEPLRPPLGVVVGGLKTDLDSHGVGVVDF